MSHPLGQRGEGLIHSMRSRSGRGEEGEGGVCDVWYVDSGTTDCDQRFELPRKVHLWHGVRGAILEGHPAHLHQLPPRACGTARVERQILCSDGPPLRCHVLNTLSSGVWTGFGVAKAASGAVPSTRTSYGVFCWT